MRFVDSFVRNNLCRLVGLSFTLAVYFSNLGWVIFGPSLSLFATWPVSVVTMTRVALGEFDNIYPLMVEVNDAAAFMIIVTYQVGHRVCIFGGTSPNVLVLAQGVVYVVG